MIALIALVLAVSLLPACSVAPVADVQTAMLPVYSAQAEPAAREIIEYEVTTEVWEDEAQADDGTSLASCLFQLPVLTAYRGDGTEITEPETDLEAQAVEAVRAFNEKFSKWDAAEEFPEFVSFAAENLAYQREWDGIWIPYFKKLTCQVYQTDHLVSVSAEYHCYNGGVHPNTYLLGWNFDLDSGTFFTPEMLSGDTGFQEAVSQEMTRQAQEKAAEYGAEYGIEPENFFWQDYEDILADWTSYTVSFDEAGMIVAFSPYELAAYAAGPQVFHLSYDWLEPYLSEHGRLVLGLEAGE